MAISGFGAQNNLRLTKPLSLNEVNQQLQPQEEEVGNGEPTKVEVVVPNLSSGQLTFDQVDSLLIGRGITINKPIQPEQPEGPSIKLQDHFNTPPGLSPEERDSYLFKYKSAREGDTFKWEGDAYIIKDVEVTEDDQVRYHIEKLND